MRISDWSSDVYSSDLHIRGIQLTRLGHRARAARPMQVVDPRGKAGYWIAAAGDDEDGGPGTDSHAEIGRASCRERVCQYVLISVVAVSLTNNKSTPQFYTFPFTAAPYLNPNMS